MIPISLHVHTLLEKHLRVQGVLSKYLPTWFLIVNRDTLLTRNELPMNDKIRDASNFKNKCNNFRDSFLNAFHCILHISKSNKTHEYFE